MLRRCPYCKGLANFDLGEWVRGGKLIGVASFDRCQNCGSPTYFVVSSDYYRGDILDMYPYDWTDRVRRVWRGTLLFF